MNKACRELMKQNNAREEAIYKENEDIYTDMILYLMGSGLSEYNQQLVRAGLIDMILDGQVRGDNINQVMGDNYKEICDDIIAAFPQMPLKEKVIDVVEMILYPIGSLAMIAIIYQLFADGSMDLLHQRFVVTVGDIIVAVIIVLAANLIVKYIFRSVYKENKKSNKFIMFIKYWAIAMVPFMIVVLCMLFLRIEVFSIPMIVAIVVTAVILVLGKLQQN